MQIIYEFRFKEALLKYNTKKSIWNMKSKEAYMSSNIAANSKHTIARGKHQLYDYCKTIICCSGENVTDKPRFLSNVYSAIFHYVSESQMNAAVNFKIS